MKTTKNDIVSSETFNSVTEFFSVINKRTPNRAFAKSGVKCSENNSEYFCGTKNWDEAQSLLKHGYKEGAKDLLNCKTTVKVISPERKKQIFADVTGFSPIVPNAIIGLPNSMLNKRDKISPSRVLNIILDIAVSCKTDKEIFVKAGKNIYSFIKSIEATGTKVNLTIMVNLYVKRVKRFVCLFVKIKDSKQAINPQLISYPIIHPSFLRRHVFRWIETSPFTSYQEMTKYYGYPGADYMRWKSGSVLRFLQENKIADKDSFYINIYKVAAAKDVKEIKEILGVA